MKAIAAGAQKTGSLIAEGAKATTNAVLPHLTAENLQKATKATGQALEYIKPTPE
jgi:hypothetical protein